MDPLDWVGVLGVASAVVALAWIAGPLALGFAGVLLVVAATVA